MSRAANVAGAQPCAEEIAVGENEQRVVHVVVVVPVEEAELLLPVGGVVGQINVEDQLKGRKGDLFFILPYDKIYVQ